MQELKILTKQIIFVKTNIFRVFLLLLLCNPIIIIIIIIAGESKGMFN